MVIINHGVSAKSGQAGLQTEISAATKHHSTRNPLLWGLGAGTVQARIASIQPSALQKAPDILRVHSVYQVDNLPLRLGYLQGEQSKDRNTSFLWPSLGPSLGGHRGPGLQYSIHERSCLR
jgi:hypothetical protein